MRSDDAGFITFLGKFGMALMYVGLGIVVLGIVRLVWNKRPAALKTPRTIGPIALPYEALPFARPGTPGSGSRPPSPSHGSSAAGSRLGTPAGRYRDDGKPSGLFYMPVWLYPSGSSDRGTPGPRPGSSSGGGGGASPGGGGGGGGQQNWSQYFSNLSFVNDEAASAHAHRQHGHEHGGYAPVPSFSRPPSPSNNSILHAPGSTHDGAFDGMPLHSIHAPRAHKASASGSTSSSSPSSPSSSHFPSSSSNPPLSPNPPAYSSLRSWGTSLFRGGVPTSFLGGSPSPSSARQPLLPVAHPGHGHEHGLEARRVHLDAAPGAGGGLGLGGPPEYAAALAVAHAAGPGAPGPLVDARGGPARAGRIGGGDPARPDRRGRAPAAAAAAPAGDRALERPAGALAAGSASVSRRSSFAGDDDEDSLEEQLDRELAGFDGRRSGAGSGRASPALLAADEGRVGPGAAGVGVEEEVDRLLSELAPEQGDEDDGAEGKKAE